MKKVLDWIDDRSGYRESIRKIAEQPLEGGSRWAYVFGHALALIITVQSITGVLLMLNYTPAVHSAWSSVFYVQYKVQAGWFVRGLHHYGASAVVIVLALHLLQVAVYGAYRKPKEINWWLGLVLFKITLGLALTGYLLPWDQKAYWASKVTTSVAGSIPLIGQPLQRLVVGGTEYGQSTLNRFFVLHVAVLPIALLLVFAGHYALHRRYGVTPLIKNATKEAYAPRQLFKDLFFSLLVVAVVVAFTLTFRGAPLDAPADPAVEYPPRPEWYFRFLFQLFKVFPGRFEIIATVVIPLVVFLFLAALPILDRESAPGLRGRARYLVPIGVGAICVAGLTGWSFYEDSVDQQYLDARDKAAERAARSVALAKKGVPPGGPLEMLRRDPMTRGADLYVQHCQSCHVLNGEGERKAPDHTSFASRRWLSGMLEQPSAVHYFGTTKIDDMPSAAQARKTRASGCNGVFVLPSSRELRQSC